MAKGLPKTMRYGEVDSDVLALVLHGEAKHPERTAAEGQLMRLLLQCTSYYQRIAFATLWLAVFVQECGYSPAYEAYVALRVYLDVLKETKMSVPNEKHCDLRTGWKTDRPIGMVEASWLATERRVRVDVAWMNLLAAIQDARAEYIGEYRFEVGVCSSHGMECRGTNDAVELVVGMISYNRASS